MTFNPRYNELPKDQVPSVRDNAVFLSLILTMRNSLSELLFCFIQNVIK